MTESPGGDSTESSVAHFPLCRYGIQLYQLEERYHETVRHAKYVRRLAGCGEGEGGTVKTNILSTNRTC